MATEETDRAQYTCLRGYGNDAAECRGPVTGRASFAGTGTIIYECQHHMDSSWDREMDLRRRYPAHQPADFDPTYAGEDWYGDADPYEAVDTYHDDPRY